MAAQSRISTDFIGSEIRIIGGRRSGKTTYLSALLRFPDELRQEFQNLEIKPTSLDAENLIALAKNIIEQGAIPAGTDIGDEPLYAFNMNIPRSNNARAVTLELVAKDYSGELFEMLARRPLQRDFIEPYLDEWCSAQGWLIMLTDWQLDQDGRVYKPAIEQLLTEINERSAITPALKNLRIAMVMTKCERGELWPCRLDAEEDLFRVRLPETYKLIKDNLPKNRYHFFACSAFGVMNDRPGQRDPRPNRWVPEDGSSPEFNTFLRSASDWKPYGLISPIYWLSTGRVFDDGRL